MLGLDLEKADVVAVPCQELVVDAPLNYSARFHEMQSAERPWASCRRIRKNCSSAEGPIPGASEGPGQEDLLRFADAQIHATLELVVPQAVVALLEGADR
jgi:hypothetical protein